LKIDVSWFDIELVQEILESENQPHPQQFVIRLRMAPPPTLMHVEADSLLQTLRNYDYHMFASKTDFHRPLESAEYSFMKIDRSSIVYFEHLYPLVLVLNMRSTNIIKFLNCLRFPFLCLRFNSSSNPEHQLKDQLHVRSKMSVHPCNRRRISKSLSCHARTNHSSLHPKRSTRFEGFGAISCATSVLTSCLPFTLRSATVRESGYVSEKVFSVASAVTSVSGELKSAGNVLTGGQRVCSMRAFGMACLELSNVADSKVFTSQLRSQSVGLTVPTGVDRAALRHRAPDPCLGDPEADIDKDFPRYFGK
jgi:hypothetical protein